MMKYKLVRKPGAPASAVENALNEAAEEGYCVEFVTNGDYLMSLWADDLCTTKNGRKEKIKEEIKEEIKEPNDSDVVIKIAEPMDLSNLEKTMKKVMTTVKRDYPGEAIKPKEEVQ
jgi:hypothetical protein